MHEHYTFISEIISDPDEQKFFSAAALMLVICIAAYAVNFFVSTPESRKRYLIPKKFSLVTFFDFFVEAFLKFHDGIIGVENRKYASFTGSIFLFLLAANFLGLIPGFAAITTTVSINVGVAIVAFIYFNYLGIKANGLYGYFRHFAGPILAMAPLIFGIEIFSTSLRVLTLNLRLYWNISADHLVMSAFMDLHPLFGVLTYFLGAFVSFMQAFIFTTLTIVYIQLATQHAEE